MTSSFVRWEKDPFFPVAEEVQQSAERMESKYRTLIHAIKDASSTWNLEELARDLRTALSTTKWQLEEFEKAARSSYDSIPSEEAIDRHREFIVAIRDQIVKIEKYLEESACPKSKSTMHLDKDECNELTLFLSAPPLPRGKKLPPKVRGMNRESAPDFLKDIEPSIMLSSSETNGSKKPHGHRRIASAADIGAWKIAIVDDASHQNSSNFKPLPPVRVPSTRVLSSMESASKGNWSKNGNIKWKTMSRNQESNAELARGNGESYENKNGFVSCDERRRQRFQYLSLRIILLVFFFLCLIVLVFYFTQYETYT